jgi:hypothetical protein
MWTIDTYGNFEQMLERSSPEVQEIARRLRALVVEVMPDVVEVPWPHQGTAGYGVGPKKNSEHFCYIAPQKERVNFGFFYGAELSDPAGLLEGTGKLLRHVKIKSVEEVERPALRQLLEAASTHRMPAKAAE